MKIIQTKTKYPNTVSQTSGGHYRTFTNLENIKNSSGSSYAINADPIQIKTKSKNQPAPITASNFKLGLPSNATVKKITVHYRHAKRGACITSGGFYPCKGDINTGVTSIYPNLPAPTISLLNVSGTSGKKGQAPSDSGSNKSVSWSGNWSASTLNSSNFGVKIDYPANTSKTNQGYLLVGYIYVVVDYAVPNLSLKVASANTDKVYNGDTFNVKVSASDSNKTLNVPEVIVNIPTGLTYKECKGGTVTVASGHVTWNPKLNNGSKSVELVFDTNFTYQTGVSSTDVTVTGAIADTAVTSSYTGTVYKELPKKEEETSSDTEGNTGDQTADSNLDNDKIWSAKVGNSKQIRYFPDFTDEEIATLTPTSSGNKYHVHCYSFKTDDFENIENNPFTTATTNYYTHKDKQLSLDELVSEGLSFTTSQMDIKDVDPGAYTVFLCASEKTTSSGNTTVTWLRRIKIDVRPTITTPYRCVLKVSEEELDRLGDGFPYVVQSNIKLVTDEAYVRPWSKGFKLRVFNNPITDNITTYYQYDNTGTSFDGYFFIPGNYVLEGNHLVVSTNNSILLNGETVSSSKTYSSLEDYNMPMSFGKVSSNSVTLTLQLQDVDNETFWTDTYKINFNAETDDFQEITVDTTDYDNLTDNQIHTKSLYYSDWAGLNEFKGLTCPFTYDERYPLYIIITGDYPEGDPTNNSIVFTEPTIMEDVDYSPKQVNGNYPYPINNLVLTSGDTSEIIIDTDNTSETIVFYDLPLDEGYGTDNTMAIRGIELTGNIEQADRCTLYANLKSPSGESKQRSIIVNDYDNVATDNNFSIGGNGDLWGFNTLEMTDLNQWEVEFSIANNLDDTQATLNFGSIQLILYVEEVTEQNIQVKIENEDIAYYGAFITDIKVPEGLETDTAYLKVDGTDTNDAYRQNIKEKTIKIEFDIGDGCSLEASTLSLRELTKLLVNDRDEFNRPLPKTLQLSNYPDVYWEYVMEKPLDTSIDINTYKCKAELTIPAGTSYDKVSTTTSNTGYVNGIARINPTIIVKPTDEIVTINETVSGQSFNIGYSNWGNNILEIDCENHIAWLKTTEEDTDPINLNKYVNYDSDWFSIIGEYAFEGVNAVIRTVDFQERW